MPDYSDPHGTKAFLLKNAELLKTQGNSFAMGSGYNNPYEDDEPLKPYNSIYDPAIKYTFLSKAPKYGTSSGTSHNSESLSFYKSDMNVRSKTYELKDNLIQSREQFKRLDLPRTKDSRESLSYGKLQKEAINEASLRKANMISLHVTARFMTRDVITKIVIAKTCRVKDIIAEALERIRELYNNIPPAEAYILSKNTIPLNNAHTISEANISNNDKLILEQQEIEEEEPEYPPPNEEEKKVEELVEEQVPVLKEKGETEKKQFADIEQIAKLESKKFTTFPEFVVLCRMTEEELKNVKDFSVENEHGKIVFDGYTDVRKLDIDSIITIKAKEVVLYPDESTKPEVGMGLNKPATVALYKCFPNNNDVRNKGAAFKKRLEKASSKQNVMLLYYTI